MLPRFARRTLASLPILAGLGGLVFAQLPQPRQVPTLQPSVAAPPAVADKDDDVEVLARGPVHEAFASTAEVPTGGGSVVERRPPDPVEELPPDQKPEGDNVQWIPGYWHWDEERKDFIWISGFWRAAPPGRVWVPGGWQEVRGGFQWVAGFWNVTVKETQHAEIEYLPPPPASLETGPTVVSPGDDYFYTPGCWVYRVNRYVWRPGFYVPHRPDWCWVPDHYRWTPCGYVFVPGFWDEPLERRGVLFAPVFFRPPVFARPRFVYTPVYAVPAPCLHTSLFVRRGFGSYYFGDYFEQRYVTAGYTSWAGASFRGSNFAVTVGVGRGFTYDPLWSYYSLNYRNDPRWQQNIANVYVGRFNGDVPRPPRTLVQQNTVVNNVTNVTNVTNNTNVIVNNNSNNKTVAPAAVAPVAMLAPLKELKTAAPNTVALKPVQADDRENERKLAKELRQVAVDRRKAETQLVNAGAVVAKADDKPRQAKVELPKTAVARAQAPADPVKAPPPPAAPGQKRVDRPAKPTPPVTVDPVVTPGAKPGAPVTPKVEPKLDPKPVPKADPPRAVVVPQPVPTVPPQVPVTPNTGTPVNPKPIVNPKDPVKPVDPKPVVPVTPITPPKGEPKKNDPPKVDPKPVVPVTPVVPPRTEPKPVVPVVPTTPAPKVDPPKAVSPAPAPVVVPPKVDPKPLPKVEPPSARVVPTPPPPTPAPVVRAATPAKVVPPPAPKVEAPKPVVVAPPPAQPRIAVPPPTPPKVVAPNPTPATGSAGKFSPARPKDPEKPKEDKKK